MSRLHKALVRALKATAKDLEEIVSIPGLTKEECYYLHKAQGICLNLINRPEDTVAVESKLKNETFAIQVNNPRYLNHGKPWEDHHVSLLKIAAARVAKLNEEVDVDALSEQLGRSPYSVALKISSLGFFSKEWAEGYKPKKD